jgi:hypothetical protein
MKDEYFQLLCSHLAEIAGQMDPENGFFRELLSRDVLTPEQLEQCRAEKTNARKVEAAILSLKHRPDTSFFTFLDVVRKFRPDFNLQVPEAPTSHDEPGQQPTVASPPTCEICATDPQDRIAFVPCGHERFCRRCADRLQNSGEGCPFCRSPITGVLQLY